MSGAVTPNGDSRSQTPKLSNFALTEYASNNLSTPGTPKTKAQSVVPEAFLLPNGYPDV